MPKTGTTSCGTRMSKRIGQPDAPSESSKLRSDATSGRRSCMRLSRIFCSASLRASAAISRACAPALRLATNREAMKASTAARPSATTMAMAKPRLLEYMARAPSAPLRRPELQRTTGTAFASPGQAVGARTRKHRARAFGLAGAHIPCSWSGLRACWRCR